MFGRLGSVGGLEAPRIAGPSEARQSPQGLVRSENQIEIEFAGESGLIQDRPVQYQRKLPYQVGHVDLPSFYVQPWAALLKRPRDIATVDLPGDVSRRRAGWKRNAARCLAAGNLGPPLAIVKS